MIYDLKNEEERYKLRSDVNRLLISRPVVEFGVSGAVKKRTTQQNSALHKYFDLLAQALSDAGLDMKKTLKPEAEIPWTADTVKEYLWRPIQKAQLQVDSTTALSTKDIDAVYDTLNRHLGSKFGVTVEFPSHDNK